MLDDKSRQRMVWNGHISIKISDLVATRLIRHKLSGCNLVTNVIYKFISVIQPDRANITLKFIYGHMLVPQLNL